MSGRGAASAHPISLYPGRALRLVPRPGGSPVGEPTGLSGLTGPAPYVQLFTAGLDSLCVWYLMGGPTPVFVRLQAPYEMAAMEAIERLAAQIPSFNPIILPGPPIGENVDDGAGYVPHRNLALLVAAAAWLRPQTIFTGSVLGDPGPDRSRRFDRATTRALTVGEGAPIRVIAPARRWTKTGLLRRTLAAYPEVAELLPLTRSCYLPVGPPCGECPGCFRRAVAEFHNRLRVDRPKLPDEIGVGVTGWAEARTVGLHRWPGLALDGAVAGLALAGLRLRYSP
jgi:hypothetical protein